MLSFGRRQAALAVTAAALAAGAGAPVAGAATASCSATGALSQPFKPWLDIASYGLAPGGNMEGTLPGWSLAGGAATVAGNESFKVGSAGDKRALNLPSGGSAKSSPTCVGLGHPTVRFFLRNTGARASTLRVDVLGVGLLGEVRSLLTLSMTSSSTWQPSLPVPLVTNLGGLLAPTGMTPISVKFTAVGGSWQVDDLYVDPYRRN